MSNEVDDDNNSYSSKNPIAIAGLSLALSYETQPSIDWIREFLKA